jgi:hypothetical protein
MLDKKNIYFKSFILKQLKELDEQLIINLVIVKEEKLQAKNEIIFSENMKKRNYLYIYYKRYLDYI